MTKHNHFFLALTIFCVIVTFSMISLFETKIYAAQNNQGVSGTETNPYIITSVDDLKKIADNPSASYKLGCNIDIEKENFTPLCSESQPFLGTFDGSFYTINNYYCKATGSCGGLFAAVGETGCVKNLNLETSYIYSSCSFAGTIVGINYGTISKCSCNGTAYCAAKKGYLGGICGKNSGTIEDCYTKGSYTGTYSSFIGGITGTTDGILLRCYSTAKVSGANKRGGITAVGESELCHFLYQNSVYKTAGNSETGVGEDDSQMKDIATYVDWDFLNVWGIDGDYPYLINAADSDLLKSLSSDGVTLSPEFNPTTVSYTATVESEKDSLTINAETLSPEASVSVNGSAIGTSVPLNFGENTIFINVVSRNGVLKTYTLKVTRKASSNASLSSLSIDGASLSPNFSKDNLIYTATADSGVSSLKVNATAEDSSAQILINGGESTTVELSETFTSIVVTVTAQDGTEKNYTITVSRPLSSNCNLKSLIITDSALSPVFSSNELSYSAQVDGEISSIKVYATPEDSLSKLKINGGEDTSVGLDYGKNIIALTVTAQDGTEKTYTITVTRAQSDNALLSSLTLSSGDLSPTFSSEKFSYSASVKSDVSSVSVNTETQDENAKVKINGGESSLVALSYGENIITVTVTAKDGTEKTYTITVTREKSNNALLSSLTLSSGDLSPTFSSQKYSYSASVKSDVSSVSVNAETQDKNAKVKINGGESCVVALSYGENIINVSVTAKDGTEKTYTITVTRALSNNALLSSLTLSSGDLSPTFSSQKYSYSASVKSDVSSVSVNAETQDKNAKVKINGGESSNVALSVGENIITVTVTAQDGTEKIYTITVSRPSPYTLKLSNLQIDGCSLTPSFNPDTYYYSASAECSLFETTISAITADSGTHVLINNSSETAVNLSVGTNIIEIKVVAPGGASRVYTVTINRKDYTALDLKSLTLSDGVLSPEFNPKTVFYTATVNSSVSKVSVLPLCAHSDSSVKINGSSKNQPVELSYGENTISVEVTDSENSSRIYTISIFRKHSDGAKLSNLSLSSGSLSPGFNSDVINYTVTQNWTPKITVCPTAMSPNSTITVNGEKVQSGENVFVHLNSYHPVVAVTVTSESGEKNSYYINIVLDFGGGEKSGLQDIVVDGAELIPAFNSATTSYSTWVENSVESINILPIPASNGETVTVNGKAVGLDGYTLSLDEGDNYAVISTTVGEKTIEYLLTIKRRLTPDSLVVPSQLDSLKTSGFLISPDFLPSHSIYSVIVGKDADKIKLTAGCFDSEKVISINDTIITSGNEFTVPLDADVSYIAINVRKGDGFSKYLLTVTKSEIESSRGLSSLVLSDGSLSPQFSATNFEYDVTVENSVSRIYINATALDSNAKITVNSESSTSAALLPGNNKVVVRVTHDDSTFEDYVLTVFRKFGQVFSVSYMNSSGEYSSEIPDSVLYGLSDDALTFKFSNDYLVAPSETLKKYKGDDYLYIKEGKVSDSSLKTANELCDDNVSILGGTMFYLSGGLSTPSCDADSIAFLHLSSDQNSALKKGIPIIYFFNDETNTLTKVDSDFDLGSSTVSFTAKKFGTYFIGVKLTTEKTDYTFAADSNYSTVSGSKGFYCYLRRESDSLRATDLHILVVSTLENSTQQKNIVNLSGNSEDIFVNVNSNCRTTIVYLYEGSYDGVGLPQSVISSHTVS